ncbi:MAG: hypothetical protein RL027_260, partial [Pseudomonadota bacterium]
NKFSKNNKITVDFYGLLLGSNNLYVTSSVGDIYKISANDGKYISHKKINNDLSRAPIIVDNKMLILNRSSELIILN